MRRLERERRSRQRAAQLKKQREPELLTIPQMVAGLGSVEGQLEAKQSLAQAVYHHYLGLALRNRGEADLARQHVLLMGPSGCGKSLLVSTLARLLGVPFFRVAATSLVEVGYKGCTIEDMLAGFLAQCQGDPQRVQSGILFIDEIDKAAAVPLEGRDVSGLGVQNALLAMLDGRLADVPRSTAPGLVTIDTSRILCVFAGAFGELPAIIQRRLGTAQRRVGLISSDATDPKSLAVVDVWSRVTTEDLIEFGMIRELVGRWSFLTALQPLSEGSLVRILQQAEGSGAFASMKRLARVHGIDLVLTRCGELAVARRASALGLGARGLQRIVGEMLRPIAMRWLELADRGVHRIEIDEGVVLGTGEPRLVDRGTRRFGRQDQDLRQVAARAFQTLRCEKTQTEPPAEMSDAAEALAELLDLMDSEECDLEAMEGDSSGSLSSAAGEQNNRLARSH